MLVNNLFLINYAAVNILSYVSKCVGNLTAAVKPSRSVCCKHGCVSAVVKKNVSDSLPVTSPVFFKPFGERVHLIEQTHEEREREMVGGSQSAGLWGCKGCIN